MRRNQKGFTLMELMVVIVIVAILAAVAVPLYINYVKDATRTEAKGAIGAIITAEQTYYQQYQEYLAFDNAAIEGWLTEQDPKKRLNCDVREAQQNWTFAATLDNGFSVVADGIANRPTENLKVTYRLRPPSGEATWLEE
jgi:prepilin-type N-terminal cleavage/methylation domain-containing protein